MFTLISSSAQLSLLLPFSGLYGAEVFQSLEFAETSGDQVTWNGGGIDRRDSIPKSDS
jgi:hypothetical protein